jgi:hypothetical protein
MELVHTMKSDSPGYTRLFFDEPLGTGTDPIVLTGPPMKHAGGAQTVVDDLGNLKTEDEREYSIMCHGQQIIDVPSEIKELKLGDKTFKLTKGE